MSPSSKKKGKDNKSKKAPPPSPKLKWISTRLLDDVFTDEVSLFKPHFKVDYEAYLQRLWDSNPEIYEIFKITRLTKTFDIYRDVESAAEDLSRAN